MFHFNGYFHNWFTCYGLVCRGFFCFRLFLSRFHCGFFCCRLQHRFFSLRLSRSLLFSSRFFNDSLFCRDSLKSIIGNTCNTLCKRHIQLLVILESCGCDAFQFTLIADNHFFQFGAILESRCTDLFNRVRQNYLYESFILRKSFRADFFDSIRHGDNFIFSIVLDKDITINIEDDRFCYRFCRGMLFYHGLFFDRRLLFNHRLLVSCGLFVDNRLLFNHRLLVSCGLFVDHGLFVDNRLLFNCGLFFNRGLFFSNFIRSLYNNLFCRSLFNSWLFSRSFFSYLFFCRHFFSDYISFTFGKNSGRNKKENHSQRKKKA